VAALLPDFYRTAPHGPVQPSRFAPISTPFPQVSPHEPGPTPTPPDSVCQAIGLPWAARVGPAAIEEETQRVDQPPEQPPKPEPQPWGGQPWSRPDVPPREPVPPPAWGEPVRPREPWGYRPPPSGEPPRPPGAPPPWYRQPVGILLIGVVVVIVLALIVPTFTSGGGEPAPTVTTGAFGSPGSTAAPGTTSAGQAPTVAEQLGQAAQNELGAAGEVTSVTAPRGGPVTVTWEITRAGSQGLTENNARFGVMRIMRAIQQSQLTAGGDAPRVRLIGNYQLPGATAPVTVVRLRFEPSTVERADFDDRDYLEAFELADVAVIHPAFRG
jgi:hypothetical protein